MVGRTAVTGYQWLNDGHKLEVDSAKYDEMQNKQTSLFEHLRMTWLCDEHLSL